MEISLPKELDPVIRDFCEAHNATPDRFIEMLVMNQCAPGMVVKSIIEAIEKDINIRDYGAGQEYNLGREDGLKRALEIVIKTGL